MDTELEDNLATDTTVPGPATHKLNAIPAGKDPKRNYWKAEEEQLLKDWADKAQCYEWMHLRSHIKYKARNAWFTIPVIIISTITGTANFAQDRFGEDYKAWVVMGVGAFNIFAGIITTIYQFLKISELSEGHRVSALYWGKFYRNLRTELAKHPLDRSNHESVLTNAKEEYDRLLEMSPMVAQTVIKEFNKKYGDMEGFTRPEIVTTRFGTDIFNMSEPDRKAMVEELLSDKIAIEKARDAELKKTRDMAQTLSQQMDELKGRLLAAEEDRVHAQHAAEAAILMAEETKKQMDTIQQQAEQQLPPVVPEIILPPDDAPEDPDLHKFKETFFSINSRYPSDQEIKTMFKTMFGTPSPDKEDSISMDIKLADLNNTVIQIYNPGAGDITNV